MPIFRNKADITAIENQMPWADRNLPATMYGFLTSTRDRFPDRPAVSYQLLSGPKDRAETLTWSELHGLTTQTANLLRSLGVGEGDVVAYLMPNCNETVLALLGGMVAGIVNPINPLLDPNQIAAILRETGAKVLVTLKAFPKAEVAGKAAKALTMAPDVTTVLEVDLNRYLTPPKSWIVPLLRPKVAVTHKAQVLDFNAEIAKHASDNLTFDDSVGDRVAAFFHTGGTTGMPKVAQHSYQGMIYNGWIGHTLLFDENDNIICPLPLFHVFAVHVILMAMISSGAHVIFPTPAGYRGEGVFDNFWKLIERWKISFIITVPTAIAALMQRPVDADVSSVKNAFSGSAPMPLELFRRFEAATGVEVIEGYGMTEATCLISCNPVEGEKKVGSVGLPLPYCDVRILMDTPEGPRECGVDEVGEICVSNYGVLPGNTYTDTDNNRDLFYDQKYLRTGDLGRLDADGYLWITGRAKDLIIRGGHNIDPALIEEALMDHEAIAFVGAVGQPDEHAGELPCAFVELVEGGAVTTDELLAFANERVNERAAIPKYIEIMDEMPKTAVGKVFKPDLRRSAITRVFDAALAGAGLEARISAVIEDKKRGLVAQVALNQATFDRVNEVLGGYIPVWEVAP